MADSLETLRERIADLADDDGGFVAACSDTDRRPVPLTGKRFPTEDAASEAAEIANEYRDRLRATDPDLPQRRFVVYEVAADPIFLVSTREQAAGSRANGLPRTSRTVTLAGDGEREWLRMENAPLVHLRRNGDLLDDAAVERQLDSKL